MRCTGTQALDGGDSASSGVTVQFDAATAHLTAAHIEYLRHWDRLISLEQGDVNRFRKEIWCMLATDRERTGAALANMIIDATPSTSGATAAGPPANAFGGHLVRFRYVRGAVPVSPTRLQRSKACRAPKRWACADVRRLWAHGRP